MAETNLSGGGEDPEIRRATTDALFGKGVARFPCSLNNMNEIACYPSSSIPVTVLVRGVEKPEAL